MLLDQKPPSRRRTLDEPVYGRFVQYSDPEIYASQFDLDALCEAMPR